MLAGKTIFNNNKEREDIMALGTKYPILAFHAGGAGQSEDGIPPQHFRTFNFKSAGTASVK